MKLIEEIKTSKMARNKMQHKQNVNQICQIHFFSFTQ